jgi:hypothetical protein
MMKTWWVVALGCGALTVGCSSKGEGGDPSNGTGGTGSGMADSTEDDDRSNGGSGSAMGGSTGTDAAGSSSYGCTGKPVAASETAILGDDFKVTSPIPGATFDFTDGYAVTTPFASDLGRDALMKLVFTNYPGCGYARAELGKWEGEITEMVLLRDIDRGPFTAGTYTTKPEGDQEYTYLRYALPSVLSMPGCGDNRLGSVEEGSLTIDEITSDRVKGKLDTVFFQGTFDLPICNYPGEGDGLECGCAP